MSAVADPSSFRLLSLKSDPRVLPYCECLAASAYVSRLIGTPLGHLRLSVVETFTGIRASLREAMGSLAEAGLPPLT